MKSVAVLDAAVLVPKGLRDLLLSCAAAGAFRPIWQEELLDELIRSCIKVDAKHARKHGIEPDIVALTASARRLADTMNRAFPDACLASARWRPRVAQMTNHERDRHVIAAAIGGNATHVVTNNLKDFPPASRHGVTVQRPDPYLVGLLTDPETSAPGRGGRDRDGQPPQTAGTHPARVGKVDQHWQVHGEVRG